MWMESEFPVKTLILMNESYLKNSKFRLKSVLYYWGGCRQCVRVVAPCYSTKLDRKEQNMYRTRVYSSLTTQVGSVPARNYSAEDSQTALNNYFT